MSLFSDALYRKIMRIHNEAVRYYQADEVIENYVALVELTSEGIRLFESYESWPVVKSYFVSREITKGNLYFFRAKAHERIEASKENLLQVESARRILNDLEQALEEFWGVDIAMPSFVGATLLYAQTCAFCEEVLESQRGRDCIKFLGIAKRYSDSVSDTKLLASLLAQEADVYIKFFNSDADKISIAVECLLQAQAIFESNGDREALFSTKQRLVFCYSSPASSSDSARWEKVIINGREALEIRPDGAERAADSILSYIATAYECRTYGDPYINVTIAIFTYLLMFETYSIEQCAELWPEEVIRLLELLSSTKLFGETAMRIHYRLHTMVPDSNLGGFPVLYIEVFLDAVINHCDPTEYPNAYFSALSERYKYGKDDKYKYVADDQAYVYDLLNLKKMFDKNEHEALWIEIEWHLTNCEQKQLDNDVLSNRTNRLKSFLAENDLCQWPRLQFERYMELANCYAMGSDWNKCNNVISFIIKDIFNFIEKKLVGYTSQLYHFPTNISISRLLPVAPLMVGDIKTAIQYFDLIASRALSDDLESLLLIEKQINSASLLKDYKYAKQGERIIQQMENDSYRKFLAEVERRALTIRQLRQKAPQYTKESFLKNFDQALSLLDVWVFVPILGNKQSRFILIPPQSKTDAIYLSDVLETNFYTELKILIGKGTDGWIHIFDHTRDDNLSLEIAKIQQCLWDSYGSWLYEIITKNSKEVPVPLCIISSGPQKYFPFAIASDNDSKRSLIDIVEISYGTSVYDIYSLNERLKSYQDQASLVAINADINAGLPYGQTGSTLASRCFGDGKNSVQTNEHSLLNILSMLKQANHWLFSTHGRFNWATGSASEIQLPDGTLTVSLLDGLEAECTLRLVMLSACETGMHDFVDENVAVDADTAGFLNKFLSIGALGVIGALWSVSDSSTALLTGRFYYYYLRENRTPASALRKAQLWVRDATYNQIKNYLDETIDSANPCWDEIDELLKVLSPFKNDNDPPFKDPQFWGGMLLMGV